MSSSETPHVTYLDVRNGLWSWVGSTDHKRIALLTLLTVSLFFAVGATLGLILQVEHLTPEGDLLVPETFDRFFTLHGILLVFLFLLPVLTSVLGGFLVPLMIGAKNVAFPRLNLFSFYLLVGAGGLLSLAAIHGIGDTGWTLAAPYGPQLLPEGYGLLGVGAALAAVSTALTGLNLIATIHLRRSPGMTFGKLPVFVWAQYISGLLLVVTTPFLLAALVLLFRDRAEIAAGSASDLGESILLYRKLFWAFAHPALHAPTLIGIGIATEILGASARRKDTGKRLPVLSIALIAILGTLSFGQQLYPYLPADQPSTLRTLGSIAGFLVAAPCAAVLLHWISMLRDGVEFRSGALLYALAFVGIFSIGGVSGLPLASVSLGSSLRGTAFDSSHFHYFLAGSTLTAFLAGLHFWWPKITGRLNSQWMARFGAVLVFAGFNLAFLPQFVLGAEGLPTRIHGYPARFQVLEVLSTAGTTVLAVGLTLPALYLIASFFWGKRAPRNPWNADGLEWDLPSPPATTDRLPEGWS